MEPRQQTARAFALIAAAIALGVGILGIGFGDPGGDTIAGPATTPTPEPPATATPDPNATPEPTATPTPTPTPTPDPNFKPPNEVKVLVANGTDIPGRAAAAEDQLVSAFGYTALPVNVDRDLNALPNAIYHLDEYDANARQIADALGFDPDTLAPMPIDPPVADLDDAHILVILGPLPVEEEPTPGD